MTVKKHFLPGIGLVLSALFWWAPAGLAHPGPHAPLAPWEQATSWPDRIIVTPGNNPSTGFSVNWRTDATVSWTVAEYAEATADSRFDLLAEAKSVDFERVDLENIAIPYGNSGTPNEGRGAVHYHSVTFRNLKPDTLYAYRVRGAQGNWSEWFQTRTAPATGPISFLYFGDAQYGVRSHASRIFRQALLTAPQAAFAVHAGDLVEKGDRDTEWAEWFEAGGISHAMIPVMPVAGNHEYQRTQHGSSQSGNARLTDLWRPQFTLPTERTLPEEIQESVYDYQYGNVLHVFVLDSSSGTWKQQLEWLTEKALKSSARWKVVSMHHSPFRPGLDGFEDEPEIGEYAREGQAAFIEAARKSDIDLVLAGHNHSYTRASVRTGSGGSALPGLPGDDTDGLRAAQDVDLVVAVSISGAMSVSFDAKRFAEGNARLGGRVALQRWGNNTPTYQVISIDGDRLDYTAYTGIGEPYDAFSIDKAADGTKMMRNGDATFAPVRQFETTGPYRKPHDLR